MQNQSTTQTAFFEVSIFENVELSVIVGFVETEPKRQTSGECPASSKDAAGAPQDTGEHHNDI